jgi:hypothetical protein
MNLIKDAATEATLKTKNEAVRLEYEWWCCSEESRQWETVMTMLCRA